MDFYEVVEKQSGKKGSIVVTPEFKPYGVHDLCCKGGAMYALNQIELVRNWALSHPKKSD